MNIFILALSLTFIATVVSSQKTESVLAVYKSNIELDCGDDEYHREVVNGTEKSTIKVEEREGKAKLDPETKKLTLVDVRGDELKSKYVCVRDGKVVKEFSFNVAPKLFKPEKSSQTVTEGGHVELKCNLLFGSDSSDLAFAWFKNETELVSDDQYKITSTGNQTILTVKKVNADDKGNFTCKATNKFGESAETIQLRVKDALAALWPFLAIVAEVLVLCIIILIYEKKCAKKSAHTEEDNEVAHSL